MTDVDINSQESAHIGVICSKTACDQCRRPRAAGMTLKQCGGCKVAWYCSKQCQVAAWPSHRIVCTSRSSNTVPPIYAPLGRATMAELLHLSGGWLQAHRFALTLIANALVELGGGVDAALNDSHIVVFQLGPPRDYDGTPAGAFTLEGASFDHHAKFRVGGGPMDPQGSLAATAIRKLTTKVYQGLDAGELALVGVLPVTTLLRDAWETSPQTSFPLCRPRVAAGRVVDEGERAALKNVARMCMAAINTGIVLRMPEDPNQAVPDMDTITQQGKSWKWTSQARSKVRGAAPGGTGALSCEFLRYFERQGFSPSPLDCFVTYHRLWPYHSLFDIVKRIFEAYPELNISGGASR